MPGQQQWCANNLQAFLGIGAATSCRFSQSPVAVHMHALGLPAGDSNAAVCAASTLAFSQAAAKQTQRLGCGIWLRHLKSPMTIC